MPLFSREPKIVVAEVDVQEAVDRINSAKEEALREIDAVRVDALIELKAGRRRLDEKIAESKLERGRLEASIAAARRRGQGRW